MIKKTYKTMDKNTERATIEAHIEDVSAWLYDHHHSHQEWQSKVRELHGWENKLAQMERKIKSNVYDVDRIRLADRYSI